jgi:hypothetical protein
MTCGARETFAWAVFFLLRIYPVVVLSCGLCKLAGMIPQNRRQGKRDFYKLYFQFQLLRSFCFCERYYQVSFHVRSNDGFLQLSGMVAIFYYSTDFFKSAGIEAKQVSAYFFYLAAESAAVWECLYILG